MRIAAIKKIGISRLRLDSIGVDGPIGMTVEQFPLPIPVVAVKTLEIKFECVERFTQWPQQCITSLATMHDS